MSSNPVSVTELSSIIKRSIETNPYLASIAVRGEVSNVTNHSSGHTYFTLKDKNAVISAAFFKYASRGSKVRLTEGISIIVVGDITVYEKRGSYQLIVKSVMADGAGELQKRIDELKQQLSREGLFDDERKRVLPYLPKKIGVVTSPTGAAFRDILKVLLRRYPNVEVLLAPAKVQGDDAAISIVRAIEELNKEQYEVDLIIAGRGGGSFEDLMPFNEEPTIRAFAESRVPIVSAVGHQIDHPLTDDVADLSAPTPSAAAEMVIPVKLELEDAIRYLDRSLRVNLENQIERYHQRIEAVLMRRIFQDPLAMIHLRQITVEQINSKMSYSLRTILHAKREKMHELGDIGEILERVLVEKKHKFRMFLQALDQLSPLKVMARGYNVALGEDSNIIKSIDQISTGDAIRLYLHDGSAVCCVNEKHRGVTFGKEKK